VLPRFLNRFHAARMRFVSNEIWLPLDPLWRAKADLAELPLDNICDILGLDGLRTAVPGTVGGKANNRVDEVINNV
jgi:hypothetical protein